MRQWIIRDGKRRFSVTMGGGFKPFANEEEKAKAFRALHDMMVVVYEREEQRTLLEIFHKLEVRRCKPFVPHEEGAVEKAYELSETFQYGIERGRVRIEEIESLVVPPQEPVVIAPGMGPPEIVPEPTATFDVIVVDEVGEPIAGIDVNFSSHKGTATLKTDAQGKASFKQFECSFGTASLKDPRQVQQLMQDKWALGRLPAKLSPDYLRLRYQDKLQSFRLEGDVPFYLSLRPEMGKLDVELYDKTGEFAHAQQRVQVEGPVSTESKTDSEGRICIEELPPGDYTLRITQNFDEELALLSQELETQVVAFAETQSFRQVRRLGAMPQVQMSRLRGLLFDANKSFLLPTAMHSLQRARQHCEQSNAQKLLIVAHCDATGETGYNDALSQQRAQSVHDYLTGEVDPWLKNYDASLAQNQRWGAREDRLMMSAFQQFSSKPSAQDATEWYQQFYNKGLEGKAHKGEKLAVDGKTGPKTRKALIGDYMIQWGPAWSDDNDFTVEVENQGCGKNFPLDASSSQDASSSLDANDRRVELFFFDNNYGICPKNSGKADGEEYLVWKKRAKTLHDDYIEGVKNKVTLLPIVSAHFRTGSAVMLPEGAAPAKDGKAPLTSVGALARALRYNEERSGHTMLIAGHTDSVGGPSDNTILSAQRAELVHALLMGGVPGRNTFTAIAQDTAKTEDLQQILKWTALAFTHTEELTSEEDNETSSENVDSTGSQPEEGKLGTGFSGADPGDVDGNKIRTEPHLLALQNAYNNNRFLIAGPSASSLTPDGKIGPKTWGALFDLYQYNMAQELGETLDGVNELRKLLEFLPDTDAFIGFGEAHPADGNNKDNTESQENRRVELLFFEEGHEPDLVLLKEAPEMTELYSKDAFGRVDIAERPGDARAVTRYQVRLLNPVGQAFEHESGAAFFVHHNGSIIKNGFLVDGWSSFALPPGTAHLVQIVWGNTGSNVRFMRNVHLKRLTSGTERQRLEGRLRALSFSVTEDNDESLVNTVKVFQSAYDLDQREKFTADAIPQSVIDQLDVAFKNDYEAPRPAYQEETSEEDESQ